MRSRSVLSMIAALAVLAAAACDDSTGPDGFAGSYRLERFEGLRLPALIAESSAGSVSIVDERIVLGDDGEGVAVRTLREFNAVTPQGNTLSLTRRLEYVVRGDRIEITYECPPLADCLAGPHAVGELVDGRLALGEPVSSKPASIYVRVD